jgi:hypothetical protein
MKYDPDCARKFLPARLLWQFANARTVPEIAPLSRKRNHKLI